MPSAALRGLVGTPPTNSRGDSLDLQTHFLLQLDRVLNLSPTHQLSVPEARIRSLRSSRLVDATPEPVARVEERKLRVKDCTGSTAAVELPARLYVPHEPSGAGLVYFHGGGFVVGSIESMESFCRRVANRARCTVLSVDYRLAPEFKFPTAILDGQSAYQHVYESAHELGMDHARLAVGGDSAGATLAAAICQGLRGSPNLQPKLQVLVYPLLDLTARSGSRQEFGEGYILTTTLIDWFEDHYLTSKEERTDVKASPGLADDLSNLAPARIVTAGFDPLRDEAESYAERLRDAGNAVEIRCETGLVHGFAQMAGAVGAARIAVDHIADDIARSL